MSWSSWGANTDNYKRTRNLPLRSLSKVYYVCPTSGAPIEFAQTIYLCMPTHIGSKETNTQLKNSKTLHTRVVTTRIPNRSDISGDLRARLSRRLRPNYGLFRYPSYGTQLLYHFGLRPWVSERCQSGIRVNPCEKSKIFSPRFLTPDSDCKNTMKTRARTQTFDRKFGFCKTWPPISLNMAHAKQTLSWKS